MLLRTDITLNNNGLSIIRTNFFKTKHLGAELHLYHYYGLCKTFKTDSPRADLRIGWRICWDTGGSHKDLRGGGV